MQICLGNKRERAPIVLIDCYVIITLFLYFFGPVRFKNPFSPFMALYLIAFLIIINISYFRALHNFKAKKEYIFEIVTDNNLESLPLWFYIIGFIIPLFMVATSVVITGFSGLTGSLSNTMAKAYTFVQSGGQYQEGIDIPMWIYMHLAIFVYLTIVDGLLFFKNNSIAKKILWFGCLVLLGAYFVLFRGAQKTLGDIFILSASAILIKIYGFRSQNRIRKKAIIALAALVVAFAITLATIMGARISYLNSIGYDAFKLHTEHWDVDVNSIFLAPFPEATKIGFACLIFYLCNGLCGLSYCLATPLTWTYGLGTFPDLSDIIGRRLGLDVYHSTYMYQAYKTYGWHHSEYWHSAFPYIASDWTFLGALIIMGLVAYVYAKCWFEVLDRKNNASIYMFSIMNIIWVYLPCNNQIFATRTTALVFIVCFILWLRRNKSGSKTQIKLVFR